MQTTSNKTILVSKVDTSKLTRGQYYSAASSSDGVVSIVDNNGREYKLPSDKVLKYFHPPVSLPDVQGFLFDLGLKRGQTPDCTCGAWAVKDLCHSDWCDHVREQYRD